MQLYTNYPRVISLSADEMAIAFNQKATVSRLPVTAQAQNEFLNFTVESSFLYQHVRQIAAQFTPCPCVLPDQSPTAYLQYVISVITDTYTASDVPLPLEKPWENLALLTIYIAEHPETKRKRQRQLTARLTALLGHIVFSTLSEEARMLLQGAALMLIPHTEEEFV